MTGETVGAPSAAWVPLSSPSVWSSAVEVGVELRVASAGGVGM